MAILEYLEEQHPEPALLPKAPLQRAEARRIAEVINSSVQPMQNLSLVKRLHSEFGADKVAWMRSVIQDGMDRLERSVADSPGPYLVGDAPSFAEVCLIPQLYNARRWGCDVSAWPTLLRAEMAVQNHPAFLAAHPDRQPDAQ
jgi:maleylpyruvate isomerase